MQTEQTAASDRQAASPCLQQPSPATAVITLQSRERDSGQKVQAHVAVVRQWRQELPAAKQPAAQSLVSPGEKVCSLAVQHELQLNRLMWLQAPLPSLLTAWCCLAQSAYGADLRLRLPWPWCHPPSAEYTLALHPQQCAGWGPRHPRLLHSPHPSSSPLRAFKTQQLPAVACAAWSGHNCICEIRDWSKHECTCILGWGSSSS